MSTLIIEILLTIITFNLILIVYHLRMMSSALNCPNYDLQSITKSLMLIDKTLSNLEHKVKDQNPANFVYKGD